MTEKIIETAKKLGLEQEEIVSILNNNFSRSNTKKLYRDEQAMYGWGVFFYGSISINDF